MLIAYDNTYWLLPFCIIRRRKKRSNRSVGFYTLILSLCISTRIYYYSYYYNMILSTHHNKMSATTIGFSTIIVLLNRKKDQTLLDLTLSTCVGVVGSLIKRACCLGDLEMTCVYCVSVWAYVCIYEQFLFSTLYIYELCM